MSYPRIQQVLEADSMFAPQVTTKDTHVAMRSGEKVLLPSLVVGVYAALKAAGCNMQSVPKTSILATAARLTNGQPVLPTITVPMSLPDPKVARKKVQKSENSKPQQSTSKPVMVGTVRAGAPRPAPVEKPIDADIIRRYQCAVASAQLLAALHQLLEKDDFPGHEVRKKKLDDLITEVEQSSSTHVNLSVKAIIRAQASINKQTSS